MPSLRNVVYVGAVLTTLFSTFDCEAKRKGMPLSEMELQEIQATRRIIQERQKEAGKIMVPVRDRATLRSEFAKNSRLLPFINNVDQFASRRVDVNEMFRVINDSVDNSNYYQGRLTKADRQDMKLRMFDILRYNGFFTGRGEIQVKWGIDEIFK